LLIHGSLALGRPSEVAVPEFGQGFPYRAFDTRDAEGRAVRFFATHADAADARPVFVALQGSGCGSHFFLREQRVLQGWHAFLRTAAGTSAQVVVVEKPGVKLFDQPARPGSAEECTEVFRQEHTQARWLASLQAVVSAVIELRGVQPKAIVAVGHSEGAFFAPRLAAADARITHIAVLAGHPLPQLQDFFDMARAGEGFISERAQSREEHMRRVLRAAADVAAQPDSTTESVFGHPHRYWRDKFSQFDWAGLERSPARFFLAHGDADRNSSIRVFDTFAIELLARKRDVTWLRVKGGDHSLGRPNEASYDGLREMCRMVVDWAMGRPVESEHKVWPLPPRM
jgi:predicted esterase